MEDVNEPIDQAEAPQGVPLIPSEPVPPITSRFLFVDVAALRAKQLRRGARLRFESEPGAPPPHKAERAAMEEVRRGLVTYAVPEWRGYRAEGQSYGPGQPRTEESA